MTRIINFIKDKEILKKSYIWIILALFYIPIFCGVIFSFNKPSDKGFVSQTWNSFSNQGWMQILDEGRDVALVNSFIIAITTSIIVIAISLITVFALWKQRNKIVKSYVTGSSNIPLINPDIITAVSLAIVLSMLFGVLTATKEGMARAIVSHVTMTLPYGLMLLYPRSEKFSKTLFEASQDLGFSKFKTWFKVYFVYMLPSIAFVFVVVSFLSFDDFIITRITSNAATLGTSLYQGLFKTWSLALGSIMLFAVIIGNIIFIMYKKKKQGGK